MQIEIKNFARFEQAVFAVILFGGEQEIGVKWVEVVDHAVGRKMNDAEIGGFGFETCLARLRTNIDRTTFRGEQIADCFYFRFGFGQRFEFESGLSLVEMVERFESGDGIAESKKRCRFEGVRRFPTPGKFAQYTKRRGLSFP